MGNVCTEISQRVSALSLDELKNSYSADVEILGYDDEYFNPLLLQGEKSFDKYKVFEVEEVKVTGDLFEEEVSCAFAFNEKKMAGLKSSMISAISGSIPKTPFYEIFYRRLQSLCGTYEIVLKQDKLREILKNQEISSQGLTSNLPVHTQLGISFGISSLLLMLKRSVLSDPDLFLDLIQETSLILSQFTPMSCSVSDPAIERALEKTSGFFEGILKGDYKSISPENQLASISPLLGIALITGNVTAAFSIIVKFFSGIQDKGFAKVLKSILPLIRALNKIAMSKPVNFIWDVSSNCSISESKKSVVTTQVGWAATEGFKKGLRFYEFGLEKASDYSIGISDSENVDLKISYSPSGDFAELDKNSSLGGFEKTDKIQFFVDMDNRMLTIYKNKIVVKHGIPIPFINARVTCWFHNKDSEISLLTPDLPDSLKDTKDLNAFEDNSQIHQLFSSLQNPEHPIDPAKQNSLVVGAYLLSLISKINEPHLTTLEKQGKSATIKIKELLSLDVRQQSLEYLHQIITQISSKKMDAEVTNIALLSTLKLIRSTLLASRLFPQVAITQEFKVSLYGTLQKLFTGQYRVAVKTEIAKVMSECFEVFFSSAEEQLPYLQIMIQNYKNSFSQSSEENKIAEGMIKNVSQGFGLYDAFSFEGDLTQPQKIIDDLIDLALSLSVKALKENIDLKPVLGMLANCLKCLISQYVRNNFPKHGQVIIAKVSLRLIEACTKFIKILKKDKVDIEHKIQNSLVYSIPPLFFTSLILCKFDFDFITEILDPAIQLLVELKSYSIPFPEILNTKNVETQFYESDHPYANNLDTSKVFKVPYAEKYILTFDSQCASESNCDILKLYSDESKSTLLFTWSGSPYSADKIEVNSSIIVFDFHSDSSQTLWGFKVQIDAVVKSKVYKNYWPSDLVTSLQMLVSNLCKKLIRFEFENPENDQNLKSLVNCPLFRYGINDKVLSLFSFSAQLPEKLVKLVGKENKTALVGINKKLVVKGTENNELASYTSAFGKWEKKYSDTEIVEELINGSENVVSAWRELKQVSGVKGPSSNIGGSEMNQAERAIFAVYISLFGVTETVSKIFQKTGVVGNSIKYIVKQSCNIRTWAQKRKQELIDSGKIVTYSDISVDIVEKCGLILYSEFRKGLLEAGVELHLIELTETIKDNSAPHAAGSKWKTVKGAMATLQKLGSLLSVSKPKVQKKDNIEIGKIWNILQEVLNYPSSAEEIMKILEKRRVRGLSRAVGYKYFHTLISEQVSSEVIETFNQCVRTTQGKIDMAQGLEATDPVLIRCVQSTFYTVYKILIGKLSDFNPESIIDLYFLLNLIESVNYPILDSDLHYFYDLNIGGVVSKLLDWVKGNFSALKVSKIFSTEQCVTSFKVITESQEGALVIPGSENLKLVCTKGEDKQPISEFIISESILPGYEDAVGPITISSVHKYLLIKRSTAQSNSQYLFSVSDSLSPEFKPFSNFLTQEDPDEKLKIEELKVKISEVSFKLLKLLIHSLNTDALQETIINELFKEFKPVRPSYSLSLDETCKANTWMGKINFPTVLQRNPVERVLKKIYKDTDEGLGIRKIIESHIRAVDHGLKGVIRQEDEELLGDNAKKMLRKHPEFRNSRGEVDFFIYLRSLLSRMEEFDQKSKDFLKTHSVFQSLPVDFYEALEQSSLLNVSNVIMYALSIAKSQEFITLLGAFTESENAGIATGSDFPEEFKNTDGNYDFYLSLNKILADTEKFSAYLADVNLLLSEFGTFPASCKNLLAEQTLIEDYQGTLLYLIFTSCSNPSTLRALSRKPRIQALLLKALSESQELSALSYLILTKALPSQHSYETLQGIWKEISVNLNVKKENSADFLSYLFGNLGKSSGFYLTESSWKKLKRNSMDSFECLKGFAKSERWRGKMVEMAKEEIETLNQKLENGTVPSEVQAGILSFLAMISPSYSGMDYLMQPLSFVKFENASVTEGLIWNLNESTCTVFSLESESFHTESCSNITGVPYKFDYFSELSTDLFDHLLKTWSNIQSFHLQNNKTPSRQYLSNKLILKRLESLTLESLIALSDKKQTITRPLSNNSIEWKKVVTVKDLLALKIETKTKSEVTKQLTNEEIQARITALDEKNQIIVTEVASLGYSNNLILAAIDSGCTTSEDIVEQILGTNGPKAIFSLKKWQDCELDYIDLSETANFYQKNKGHMVIVTSSNLPDKKIYTKSIDDSIFHETKWFIESVSIFICISGVPLQHKCEFGVKIGELDIKFESVLENTKIDISGKQSIKIPTQGQYVLKIFAYVNGEIEVNGDNFSMKFVLNDESVFNGTSMGGLSIYLKEGNKCELKGFSVFEGRIEKTPKFFEEDLEAKDQFGPLLKPRIVEMNYLKNRLQVLGTGNSVAKYVAEQCCDLDLSIQELMKQDSSTWTTPKLQLVNSSVYNIKVFDSVSTIESGFEEIQYFETTESSKSLLANRKIIGIKKTAEGTTKCISEIALEEIPGSQLIGEILIDSTQESQKLYAVYSEKTGIKDLAIIISKTPLKVLVPPGFQLLSNKEGFAINLANKSEKNICIFLAYTLSDYLLGMPIKSLSSIQLPPSNYGLWNTDDSKDVNSDTGVFKNFSLLELLSTLQDLEEKRIQGLGKNFMLSISHSKPEALVSSAENKGVSYLLNMFSTDYVSLLPFLKKIVSESNKKVIEKIAVECISQIITAATMSQGNDQAKVYESAHSYGNNMDTETEIYFPGALKLNFTFDSQCYTESSYDYVAFYRKPNKVEEILRYSGQGSNIWLPFEHIGDRIYMTFHSDGSGVYWGYKFTVAPTMPNKKKNVKKVSIDSILYILEFFGKNEFSVLTDKFFKREVILPLFLLVFSSNRTTIIDKCLSLLPMLMKNTESYHKDILDIILGQGEMLKEKLVNGPNILFTSVLNILCKFFEIGKFLIKTKWFLDFYNCYYDIKELNKNSGGLEQFLFENFQNTLTKPIEKNFESQHPYSRECKSELISFPGANSLKVVFDPTSALDDGDEIFFSADQAGLEALNQNLQSNTSFCFSNTSKGPDISLSNNDYTVTRTNSSGWGMAVCDKILHTSNYTIVLSIDNTGDSEYFYLSLIDSNHKDYTTCPNADITSNVWSWKKNGDFFKRGETTSKGSNYGFNTGDIVTIIANFSETSVYFYKNNELMHSFNDLGQKVILALSFGGSNQFASLISCSSNENTAGTIKKRKFVVEIDGFYSHFPVNAGVYDLFKWENTNESTVSMTPVIVNRTSGEGPSVHLTNISLTTGRHYCEFEFTSIPDKSIVAVFLSKESIDRTQTVFGNCACYKNTGNVLVGPNTITCKGFKQGEKIGIFLDYQKSDIKLFKNKLLVNSTKMDLSGEPHKFGVMLTTIGQSVKIVQSKEYPEDIDMLGIKQQMRFNQSNSWGYKFKVTPVFSNRSKETLDQLLKYACDEDRARWRDYYEKFLKLFKGGAAEELIALCDELVISLGKESEKLVADDIAPSKDKLIYFKELEQVELVDMKELFKILQVFNKNFKENLPIFDLDIGEHPTEFQSAFMTARKFVFFDIKQKMFVAQLDKTKNDSRPDIVIDRTKATRYRQQGKKDLKGQFSVFGQVLRALSGKNNTDFRNAERIFKVTYRGEGAIDAGGPYNEVISNFCEELQSDYLPLLTPTQNHLNNTGEYRDAWILNSKSHENAEEMFLFLGKIIGVAIRTQNNLNLCLAPLVWKKIVADCIEYSDLKSVDEICYQMIEIIRNLDTKGITKENFLTAFSDEVFTTRLSNSDLIELIPNGKNINVTYENCLEYAKLTQSARLNEANEFYKVIRKGISAVIPLQLLNLFSWKQVETLICGAIDIKVDLLKQNTDYSGTSESEQHITYFWEVLTEMTAKERQLYLKFVWGRSRLPASKTFTHMKITKLIPKGPVDTYLPVAHTCFFTIDLPPYNSKAVMKDKLLYAITHCTAIDLDTTPTGGWEEND